MYWSTLRDCVDDLWHNSKPYIITTYLSNLTVSQTHHSKYSHTHITQTNTHIHNSQHSHYTQTPTLNIIFKYFGLFTFRNYNIILFLLFWIFVWKSINYNLFFNKIFIKVKYICRSRWTEFKTVVNTCKYYVLRKILKENWIIGRSSNPSSLLLFFLLLSLGLWLTILSLNQFPLLCCNLLTSVLILRSVSVLDGPNVIYHVLCDELSRVTEKPRHHIHGLDWGRWWATKKHAP